MNYTTNLDEYYEIKTSFDGVTYHKVNEKNNIDDGIYINKNYDKVVLVAYEYSSGGNFLINSLSLSDDVCSSFNSIKEKEEYFNKSLNDINLYWSDFTICDKFFTYEDIKNNNKEKYFFIFTHIVDKEETKSQINYHLKRLKNCKVIYFVNSHLFVKLRRCVHNYKGSYNFSKFKSLDNIKFSDYFTLSEKDKTALKNKYTDVKKYSYCDLSTKQEIYIWDVNSFLSEEDYLNDIKQFYIGFNLSKFDEKSLRKIYRSWIKKLSDLSEIPIPKKYKPWTALISKLYNDDMDFLDVRTSTLYQNFDFDLDNEKAILFLTESKYDFNLVVNCLSFSKYVSCSKTLRYDFLIENINDRYFFLNDCTAEGKYFFIVDHLWTKRTLSFHKSHWKNSTVIVCSENEYYNDLAYKWDPNFYLKLKDFLINIKKLYNFLGFDDYDEDLIKKYYIAWMSNKKIDN
jgi:hypothetical protein